MNPYLQQRWPDVHTSLLGYIKDELAPELPQGLVARAEEAVEVNTFDAEPRFFRADVSVGESWRQGIAPAWNPEADKAPGGIATEPEIIYVPPATRRWLEICTPDGRVVTVIEIVSPVNKTGKGREKFLSKQRDLLAADVNLVVIDLIRGGQNVLPVEEEVLRQHGLEPANVCVVRGSEPEKRELYRIPLRRRLPVIRIPLRSGDADIPVDLQPLLDRCYEMGGHWQNNHRADPEPPLSTEDNPWVDECLKTAGLRP